jgi:hypothetical protein
MVSPVEASILLCDASTVDPATGKVHMLGAGWSQVGTPTPPGSVVVLLQIPWDRANEPLAVELTLCDADGRPVDLPGGPISVRANLEVGRPAGARPGEPMHHPFELKYPPLELPPGRYEWRLTVAGDIAVRGFTVRPPADPA